jgi:uncharacterized protein YutE (UPF0331/DUF86 family)
MVRPEVIRRRLHKLDEYLSILDQLRKYSLEVFVQDPEHYGSAERFLQLCIEVVSDIGSHLIADLELGEVSWQRDIPDLLAKKGHIEPDLAEKWIRMIGFRNILVHNYLDIDRQTVYDTMQNNLSDFRELQSVFARFI